MWCDRDALTVYNKRSTEYFASTLHQYLVCMILHVYKKLMENHTCIFVWN